MTRAAAPFQQAGPDAAASALIHANMSQAAYLKFDQRLGIKPVRQYLRGKTTKCTKPRLPI